VALCLLKNIETMKKSNIEIKEEWLKQDLITFKIPSRILEGLGISRAGTTLENSFALPTNNISRSPTALRPSTAKPPQPRSRNS
jgi:hypothetical protein